MTKHSAHLLTLSLALTTSFACVGEESFDLDDEQLRNGRGEEEEEPPPVACPRYLCGGNAAVAAAYSFNFQGQQVLDNKRMTGVTDRDGAPMRLHLSGNTLSATYLDGGAVISGSLLAAVGVTMHFIDYSTQSEYEIVINDVGAGVYGMLDTDRYYPTYQFDYINADGQIQSLCGDGAWDEGNLQPTTKAIVAQHEAYDWWGNPVNAGEVPLEVSSNWLTIGCSGGAYAKKVLMGYDLNNPAPLVSNYQENTAMMRMLTASYCGGTAFTQTGTEIYWQNYQGWFQTPDNHEIEALWDEDGAVCLNNPRYAPRGAVLAECGWIPTCEGFNPNHYMLMSYHLIGE